MKHGAHKDLKKALARNHACYVLITCNAPGADGNMNVEMSYNGDTALAAYLIEGAQNYIAEQSEEQSFYG